MNRFTRRVKIGPISIQHYLCGPCTPVQPVVSSGQLLQCGSQLVIGTTHQSCHGGFARLKFPTLCVLYAHKRLLPVGSLWKWILLLIFASYEISRKTNDQKQSGHPIWHESHAAGRLVFFLIAFFSVTASVYHASHTEYALFPKLASTNDVMQWRSLLVANLSHHPKPTRFVQIILKKWPVESLKSSPCMVLVAPGNCSTTKDVAQAPPLA